MIKQISNLKLSREKVDKYVEHCLQLMDAQFYNKALLELQKGLVFESKHFINILEKNFDECYRKGNYEAALTLGIILGKKKPNDFVLLNKIGNCARKSGNNRQANTFYRSALKINKRYEPAFYNLAAGLGRVEKYDLDVKYAIDAFKDIKKYILPDYFNASGLIQTITEQLISEKVRQQDDLMRELSSRCIQLEGKGELIQVDEIKKEILRLKSEPLKAEYPEILQRASKIISKRIESLKNDDTLLQDQFDVGLLALNNNDSETALKHLLEVKEKKADMEYLDMLIALAKDLSGVPENMADILLKLLGKNQYDRFLNINLGLMYRKQRNRLLECKYLIIGAALLEKSEGIYKRSDLIKLANEHFEKKHFEKAMALYKIIAAEINDIHVLFNMALIHGYRKNRQRELELYRKILEIDPFSEAALKQIRIIHDEYQDQAEIFVKQKKYKAATEKYEKAIEIMHVSGTIADAIQLYKQLNHQHRVAELRELLEQTIAKETKEKREQMVKGYIEKGKKLLNEKKFKAAIQIFEKAFSLKKDKDSFIWLAYIYKQLKLTSQLEDLLSRWRLINRERNRIAKVQRMQFN